MNKPVFILTVGDSLMSEVSQGLRDGLSKDIKIKDVHKSSTGLTNDEYYNWPQVAFDQVSKYQPDTVIIHMGGNDGQDMKIGKQFVHITDPLWKKTYEERAQKMVDNIKKAKPDVHIIWLGLPAMRDTKFANKMDIIRSAQFTISENNNIPYIDGKEALGSTYQKQGSFEGKVKVWRRTDGIHYSRDGGIVMAHQIINDMKW